MTAQYDRDQVWRAVCDAVAAELVEQPEHRHLTRDQRHAVTPRLAAAVLARIEAPLPRRVWTGTRGEPCWVCDAPEADHAEPDHACPSVCWTGRELSCLPGAR